MEFGEKSFPDDDRRGRRFGFDVKIGLLEDCAAVHCADSGGAAPRYCRGGEEKLRIEDKAHDERGW